MPITGGTGLLLSREEPRRSKLQRSHRMGKKYPARRPWTVQLRAIYRPDRDERIARAYELALPILVSRLQPRTREEDPSNEALPTHRPLRARF
jgi:hypothetical protein